MRQGPNYFLTTNQRVPCLQTSCGVCDPARLTSRTVGGCASVAVPPA